MNTILPAQSSLSLFDGANLNHIPQQAAVTSLTVQYPASASSNSLQATQFDVDSDLLAILYEERTKQPFMNMDFQDLMSFLKDTPGFTSSPQSTGTDQNTLSSNASLRSYQDVFLSGDKLPTTSKPIDNAILARTITGEQHSPFLFPMEFNQLDVCPSPLLQAPSLQEIPDSSQCEPFTAVVASQNQCDAFLKFDHVESKVIHILANPRENYRPRTQNESRTSAHYLRCEEDVEYDHPTISLPKFWTQQSDSNYIEVTLVDTAKQPHPYFLRNKTSEASFKNKECIVQQNEKNTLYYPLTNEDFLAGYKTLMVELIKCKQDDTITKKLINQRQLDQSMLRFARIYTDKNGEYHRDKESVAYSSVMKESYGEVAVEHMGPRYGVMHEKEMTFVLLKGRVMKDALKIVLTEQTTRRSITIDNFTLNGTVAYFLMPACTYSQNDRVTVDICVYYRKELLQKAPYTYLNMSDQHGIVGDVANSIHVNRQKLPIVVEKALKSSPPKRLQPRKKTC